MKNSIEIIPARIREAREAAGLSMAELSDLIGVTSQAISQYEKGITNPSIFVLKKISNELNFPISFFGKSKPEKKCQDSAVFFRAMKSTPKKLKNAYKYHIEWTDEIYKFLNKYVEFCNVNLPDISYLLPEDNLEHIDKKIIEDIAIKVREYWQLADGPIYNMVDVLQDNGIIISRIKFKNRKIDAFSQWYDGMPYIFLGSDKGSAVRSRFDVAHELGHLLMHPNLKMDQVYKKDILDRIEEEANYFAGALLMPITSFPDEVLHNSIDYFIMLKEKWKVSIGAIIMRSKQLNLFTDNQINYLNRQMTMRKYWRCEPLDDVLKYEEPDMLKEAIELLIENKIITPKQFIEMLSLPTDIVLDACYLSNSFLIEDEPKPKVKLKVIK